MKQRRRAPDAVGFGNSVSAMALNKRLAAVLAIAALAGLPGCSKSSAVVSRCVADGDPKEVCACWVQATEKSVDPHMFQVIVLGAEGKGDEAQTLYNSLPADIQLSGSQAVRAAREQCKDKAPKPPVPPKASSPPPAAPPPSASPPSTAPTPN